MAAKKSASSKIRPGSLTIVHFVEQQLEGWEFERSHWPLHITLVSWFEIEDDEAVMRSLDRLADATPPMRWTVGPTQEFGPRKKLANVIKNEKEARNFHNLLRETLEGADVALHESRYTGADFKAHITRHKADGRHSNEGERIMVGDFHMVRLVDDNTCRVEQTFELTGR